MSDHVFRVIEHGVGHGFDVQRGSVVQESFLDENGAKKWQICIQD